MLLDQFLAVLVPGAAHLAAAAHVRDRVDDAAQDRQAQGLELGVVADLVRAVPDLPARVRAVRARVAVVDEGDGDAGRAVAREHPHALLDELGGVPTGRLAGAQGAHAKGRDLACVFGGRGLGRVRQSNLRDRGRHGLRLELHAQRILPRGRHGRDRAHRGVHFDAPPRGLFLAAVPHVNLRERTRTQREGHVVRVGLDVGDALAGSGGAQRLPRLERGEGRGFVLRQGSAGRAIRQRLAAVRGGGRHAQLSQCLGRTPFGQHRLRERALLRQPRMHDEQVIPRRICRHQRAGAHRHERQRAHGRVGGQPQPRAARGRRRGMNDDVPRETRRREPHLEALVRLDQQQLVGLARRAHAVQPHVARAPCVVHAHVDKGSGIIRPREAVPGVHNSLVDDAPRRLLHDPRVALIPACVPRPRDQAPIRGRVQVRQAEKFLPARPLVLIDEELLAPRGHARRGDERDRRPGLVALDRRAVMRRVGLALRETPEVPELALADRNRHVGERRGSLDLLHEARGRLARRLGHRVRPRVLRLQVRAHLGIIAVAQPIPRVIKMLSELVAYPMPITFRGNRGSVWRGLGCLSRDRLSHGDHLRGGGLRGGGVARR